MPPKIDALQRPRTPATSRRDSQDLADHVDLPVSTIIEADDVGTQPRCPSQLESEPRNSH